MKAKLFQNAVTVRQSPVNGYGVFADKIIRKGDVVEECYCVVSTEKMPAFANFAFKGSESDNVIPLGYGCIYNHSPEPNLKYEFYPHSNVMVYTAIRDVAKGEELFISYGDDWFASRELKVKTISKLLMHLNHYRVTFLKVGLLVAVYYLLIYRVLPV